MSTVADPARASTPGSAVDGELGPAPGANTPDARVQADTAAPSGSEHVPAAGALMLVLPALVRRSTEGRLWIERQAHNGMMRWAESFERVNLACEVQALPAGEADRYLPMDDLLADGRINLIELPRVSRMPFGSLLGPAHLEAKRQLCLAIDASQYLCIALGHFREDWSHLAARLARRAGRRYAIWTDRVEYQVVLVEHEDRTGWRRLYRWARARWLLAPMLKRMDERAVRGASLGLFHGQDCYDAYARWVPEAHIVHDVHLRPDEHINEVRFAAKRESAADGPLRIVYVGRAAAMKGPDDWIRVMRRLRRAGLRFEATWLGDGPLLPAMQERIASSGLGSQVKLAGHVSDRATVLDALRDAHLMVFCHQTPESPRNLIEALMSGTPIVGYDSPYARDLVGADAARWLVPPHPDALAQRVAELAGDPQTLDTMLHAARQHGRRFSDEAVFAHRSRLIRRVL
jgi:colanic acid/amylovoran biosynthesis glycosyltransferase